MFAFQSVGRLSLLGIPRICLQDTVRCSRRVERDGGFQLLLLDDFLARSSVQARVRDGRDGVEEEEGLRTGQELLATRNNYGQQIDARTIPKKDDSQAQRNVPIPIRIVPLEHIRHSLQADARLHEEVE